MKKRTAIYLIIIITIVNVSSLGTMFYLRMSGDNVADRSEWQKHRFEKVKKELNLTDAQVQEFNKIKKEFHARLDSLDERYAFLRNEIINSIKYDSPDSPRIELILNEFSELQNETQRWIVKHFYRFKNALTPKQAEKFFEILMRRLPKEAMNSPLNRMPGNH